MYLLVTMHSGSAIRASLVGCGYFPDSMDESIIVTMEGGTNVHVPPSSVASIEIGGAFISGGGVEITPPVEVSVEEADPQPSRPGGIPGGHPVDGGE